MPLKKKLSKLLNIDVENVGWDEAFKQASIRGNLAVTLPHIIREICKQLDPYAPDLMEKLTSVNEPVNVYNPLTKDFSVQFDVMGTGSPMTFTAKSQEITSFDPAIATHLKKHLINAILAQKEIGYPTEEDIRKIDQEISIKPQL